MRTAVTAVLTGPQPVDGDSQLRTDLARLGVTVITADGPAATARAVGSASHAGRVALVDPRLAAHPHVLRLALLDPRWEAVHAPGVFAVSGAARDRLAADLRAMPDLTGHHMGGSSPASRLTAPVPLLADEFAKRLRASGVAVHEVDLPEGLVARLVESPIAARKDVYAQIAALDDESIRLRRAVKGDDGLFSTFFVSSWSRYLARWCAQRGSSPNTVMLLSLVIALAGGVAAATGTRAGYICTAVALYLSLVLDRASGQLARYALQYSRIRPWLEATFDRVKEYAVYAGLALGAVRGSSHDHGIWLLAVAAMALQTLRDHIDFAYYESLCGQADEGEHAATSSAAPPDLGYAVRKIAVLPLGERWALIAILAAATTPRIVFSVLLIWGVLAAGYTTYGQVQRSLRSTVTGTRTDDAIDGLRAMCDLPLAVKLTAREPFTAKLGWLAPPLIQLIAYGVIIGLIVDDSLLGAASFALLAVVVYHHYDVVFRLRADAEQPPHWVAVALGGNLGRSVLVVILGTAVSAGRSLSAAIWVLAAYLALVALVDSVRFWIRPTTPALPD